MSKLTDTIITMNSEDYERALEFKIPNTYKVNGVGIDLSDYNYELFEKKEIRSNLRINQEDFVILMIAEVNSNKNHKQLIEAIDILTQSGISLEVLCAGDGLLMDKVQEEIKIRNLQNYIKMLGFRNDIKELIAACDIGILLSYREGLPRCIMELMACGKPVIGTDIRGIRDLIDNGRNGFLVEVGDSIKTAQRIRDLYEDSMLLDQLSRNAYDDIRKYEIYELLRSMINIFK
jgi:glycosyltransferase involved in cell wall biosynthesis